MDVREQNMENMTAIKATMVMLTRCLDGAETPLPLRLFFDSSKTEAHIATHFFICVRLKNLT